MLKISRQAKISKFADIEDSLRGSILLIDQGVHIDSFVKIKFVGGSGDIRIGENTYINSGTVIYSGNGISIGKNVLIASNCSLAPTNHAIKKDKNIIAQRFMPSRGGIIIEDDVWIGANTVILDGAILRKGCVVGAHSLVNKELEGYSINVGSPTKKIGYRE
ncbi:MAG: acyltransferase [Candidatus Omnitrophica bacterium]|nr:acyltransferase [Candidatus Omnitrophota bacterium]